MEYIIIKYISAHRKSFRKEINQNRTKSASKYIIGKLISYAITKPICPQNHLFSQKIIAYNTEKGYT